MYITHGSVACPTLLGHATHYHESTVSLDIYINEKLSVCLSVCLHHIIILGVSAWINLGLGFVQS